MLTPRTIIIGGGISGLAAAYYLAKGGASPTIIESRPRLGGVIQTDKVQGCTIEAHNFQRDLEQYTAKHAAIVGVSADSIDSHQQFCTKESLTFRLLADPAKDVIGSYGSLAGNGMVAARNTFLIDPNGVIRKVYTKVNPNPHSQEVLTDLAELGK